MLTRQDRSKAQGGLRAARATIAGRDDLATPSVEPDAAAGWLEVLVDAVVPDGPGCVADVRVLDGSTAGRLIQDVRCPAGLYVEGDVTLLFLRGGGDPVLAPAGGGAGGGDVTNNYTYWFASTYGSE